MFKLNLKIALRSLFKNKAYAAINIGGLAIGLSAFVLLLLFINHERNYDKWDGQLDQVYQIREYHDFFTPDNKNAWQQISDSRVGNLLSTQMPQFKYVTKVGSLWGEGNSAIKIGNADPIMVKGIRNTDSLFFKVFPYQFLQGDINTALSTPNAIVLKQSFALKLFGTDQVLGKQVRLSYWVNDEGIALTVTGVIADPSTAETLTFNAIMHNGEREKDPENINSTNYCHIYALANKKLDSNSLNSTLQKVYVGYKSAMLKKAGKSFEEVYKKDKKPGLKAIPLQSVHANPTAGTSWFNQLKPILALCVFLLLVSIINFVNLATAQSVQRAKEVGVKKVLGAYKKQLIAQFLFEAAIQTLAALFICVVLVEVMLPAFGSQFKVELSFWHNEYLWQIILQLIALFILITLLAGFYPAWILSKYSPVKVLKGNYETGFKGLALRNGLVVLQFVIAVTFIIGIGVMHLQTRYMANKDLGFERDKLVNLLSSYDDSFADRIRKIAGVKYVATTTQVMGNTFNVPREFTYDNQQFKFNTVQVSLEALPALGVQVLKGRIFSPAYKQDTVNTIVINETAANLLGKEVLGKQVFLDGGKKEQHGFQIVGIIKDYNNEGFDKAVLPTVYKLSELGGTSNTNNLLVRFDSQHYQQALKAIEMEWKKVYPNFPINYKSLEDTFQKELESSKRLMQLVMLFSLISVLLSLLGLFALSAFMAKRRTKEIAIRKILGATDLQLIHLLNRSFLALVIVANLISWPVAYIFARSWLVGFAYRIEMPIWPYLLATLTSILIALFTVSIQARKAAVNNPVNALKYE